MTSHSEVPFKRITLYKDGRSVGWVYCPLVSKEASSISDVMFYELDVMRYVPKILNNIALDSGNKITRSIPLGHLGNFDFMFSPQRFVEQVMAFEYLFDKLESKRAQDKNLPLKKELECMFYAFPKLLSDSKLLSDKVSEQIKEIRRTIAHGYAYYYDFKNDSNTQYLILLLDKVLGGTDDIRTSSRALRDSSLWGLDEIVKEGDAIFNTLHRFYPDLRHGSRETSVMSFEEAVYWVGRMTNYISYMRGCKNIMEASQ